MDPVLNRPASDADCIGGAGEAGDAALVLDRQMFRTREVLREQAGVLRKLAEV